MSAQECPVCELPANVEIRRAQNQEFVRCIRCGEFTISAEAKAQFKDAKLQIGTTATTLLSSWLREHWGSSILAEDITMIVRTRMPEVGEKADRLLRHLAKAKPKLGALIPIAWPATMACHSKLSDARGCSSKLLDVQATTGWALLGVGFCGDQEELDYLLREYLVKHQQYLELEDEAVNILTGGRIKITPSGWSRIDELRRGSGSGAVGFIAMWFNDEVKAASEAIHKAITVAGYEPVRVDRIEHNNRIDDEIIARIRGSKFLVADLTGQRGGVYFEAGFALGFGLPVIWLVREDGLETVHFDNRQYNFIVWRPDALDDLEQRLRNRIEATLGRGPFQDKANVVAKKGETRPAEVVAASVFTTP